MSVPPTPTKPPSVTNFDSLAAEIKLQILRYRLLVERPITAITLPEDAVLTNLLNLLLTNKAMRAVASQVYYGENTFVISRTRTNDDPRQLLRYPPVLFSDVIRKLEVQLRISTEEFRTVKHMLDPGRLSVEGRYMNKSEGSIPFRLLQRHELPDDWMALARPKNVAPEYYYSLTGDASPDGSGKGPWVPVRSQWQMNFPALHTLKLVLTCNGILVQGAARAMLELPTYGIVDLKPMEVEIEVRPLTTAWYVDFRGKPLILPRKPRDMAMEIVLLKRSVMGMFRLKGDDDDDEAVDNGSDAALGKLERMEISAPQYCTLVSNR